MSTKSYFDGGIWGLLGITLGTFLLSILSLGIAVPWLVCWKQRWVASHTVIEGRRLRFTGTGGSLIWRWLKLLGLTIITLGIYGFWTWLYMKRWVVEHTEFA